MIGQTISHYRILEHLGAGGMGVVYKAEDLKLKRTVALKFLPPELTRNPEAMARFSREAQAAAAFSHPNICTIHAIEEAGDQLFIAMEYVEGQNLKDRIGAEPLPLNVAIEYARQLAEGLQAAHERGIVHRDIKSANIMVTPGGQIKIMDFGLARTPDQTQLTRTGTTLGTVAYMSPEQARGEEVGPPADIWALGVVLYEMVAGHLPFRGDHGQTVIYAILNQEPAPLAASQVGVPYELERIVGNCLAKNLAKRFPSAAVLASDLQSLSSQIEVLAQKGEFRNWILRHRRNLLTSGALVLALVLVGTLAWRFVPPKGNEVSSLAVLPMHDPAASADEEYLAEGLTGELIACLSRLVDFKVISRRSTANYKDTDKSLAEIAAELDVDGLVEVYLERDGPQAKMSVELIRGRTEEVLWAERFEGVQEQLLPLQYDVAMAIAGAIGVELGADQQAQLRSRQSSDPVVDQLYLKARYNFFHGNQQKAIARFNEVLAIDPFHAQAYAGLALCLRETAMHHGFHREVYPQVRAAAAKALELDDSIADAHVALAQVHAEYDWDWPGAQREFLRALELDPANAAAHLYYGCELLAQTRFDEGIDHIKQAVDLDPLSLYMRQTHAWSHLWAQRYDRAVELFNEILVVHPEDAFSKTFLAWTHALKGEFEEAHVWLDESGSGSFLKGLFCALAGDRECALQEVLVCEQAYEGGESAGNAFHAARIYAALGENDRAFQWLEKAYSSRTAELLFLRMEPVLGLLKTDPRFDELVKKIGYWPEDGGA